MIVRSSALPASLALLSLLVGAPAAVARQDPDFGIPPGRDLVVPAFTDREVADLLATLDAALADRQPAPPVDDARQTLWSFATRLQAGRLTTSQEATVLDHLAALGRVHREYRDSIERSGFMVRGLTVGKLAPETTGRDLTGTPFSLSDYRGKVVVLAFSADWCGICRSQYPYLRLMQELYVNWPFAILGVETGARESALRLKAQAGLTYRSWWDGPGTQSNSGPITSAWNVLGWPTTYVLDADGVIRFVGLRDEDLLKGVRQLLAEHMERAAASAPRLQ